ADFKDCAKGPNPNQCKGKDDNCVNNCKLGDCKVGFKPITCEVVIPPQPNQELCNGCLNNCCADFKDCAKGPNPDQCKGKDDNCVNNCKLGDCKVGFKPITCEVVIPPQPNQDLCNGCLNNCCADFKDCAKGPNPDQCKGKDGNCVKNCKLGNCKGVGFNYKCEAVIPPQPNPDLCNGCLNNCCADFKDCAKGPTPDQC